MKQKTLLHSYRNTNNKIANSSNSCCSFCFYIVHVMKFEIQVLCLLVFSTKNKQLQQIGESWSVNKFVIKYFVKILLFGNTASLMWIFRLRVRKVICRVITIKELNRLCRRWGSLSSRAWSFAFYNFKCAIWRRFEEYEKVGNIETSSSGLSFSRNINYACSLKLYLSSKRWLNTVYKLLWYLLYLTSKSLV